MKVFQSQIACLYGHSIHVSQAEGMPSLTYPNGGGYCYHDFIEIEFFSAGAGIHHLNGIPYRVRGGYFYLLMPGDFHYYDLDESAYFKLYNIKLDASQPSDTVKELLAGFPRPYAVYLEGDEFDTVLREIQYLYDYWSDRNNRKKNPVDAMTCNIAERIILLLIRNLKQPQKAVSASVPQEVRNITEYIDQHFHEPITPEVLAPIAGVTPHYFSEYFKKQCGICFCDYVNQVRLFRAMHLLDTTELSVKEIAGSVGFRSQAYFTRMFTRQFSLSPREYRQKKQTYR